MRKKAELEKRFETDGAATAGSDDSDVDDEDKIAEQEEAGEFTPELIGISCQSAGTEGQGRSVSHCFRGNALLLTHSTPVLQALARLRNVSGQLLAVQLAQ